MHQEFKQNPPLRFECMAAQQGALFMCCLLQFLSGAICFALGLFYSLLALNDNFDFDGAQIPIAVTVLGALLMSASFIGCFAVKKGDRNYLLFYILFVLALILFQFSVGIGALVVSRNARDIGFVQWRNMNKAVIEDIENELGCCGFNTTLVLRATPACAQFHKPCLDVISDHFVTLGAGVTALLVFQIISLFFAIKIFVSTSKKNMKADIEREENENLLTGGNFNAL
jgi:hypothetical protein